MTLAEGPRGRVARAWGLGPAPPLITSSAGAAPRRAAPGYSAPPARRWVPCHSRRWPRLRPLICKLATKAPDAALVLMAAAAAAALAAADPPPAMPQAAGAGGSATRRDFYWLRSFLAGGGCRRTVPGRAGGGGQDLGQVGCKRPR